MFRDFFISIVFSIRVRCFNAKDRNVFYDDRYRSQCHFTQQRNY